MNETLLIENYLLHRLQPGERLVMEARLLTDANLRDQLYWQQQTYALVNAYGRKCLRQEIAAIEQKLFSEKKYESFRQKIKRIFQ